MRSKRLARQRWIKRVLIASVAVLLFLLLVASLNFYLSKVAARQFKKSVGIISNNLYEADFSALDVHLLSGKIILKNFRLKPRDAVFNRQKITDQPGTQYTLVASRIEINHFHPFKLYFQNRLQIDRITINQPKLNIDYQLDTNSAAKPPASLKAVEAKLTGKLTSVRIALILLDELQLRYQQKLVTQENINHFEHVQIRATDFWVDKNSTPGENRFYFCKDITAIFKDFAGLSANKRYQYQAKAIVFSSSRSSIRLKSLFLRPANPNLKNTVTTDVTKPELSFEADSVNIIRFDYRRFLLDRNFIASQLSIYSGKATVFFDHRQALQLKLVRRPGIYQLLKSIPHDVAIKQVFIDNINFAYSEISPKTNLFGTMTFEQLGGTISNLNFGKDTANYPRDIVALLNANLMGYGKLNLYAHFDAANPNALLYYRGNLGTMNLANLNPSNQTA